MDTEIIRIISDTTSRVQYRLPRTMPATLLFCLVRFWFLFQGPSSLVESWQTPRLAGPFSVASRHSRKTSVAGKCSMFGLQQAPAADVARCVAAACGVGADVFQWSDADGCWVGDYGADGVANPDVTSGARPSVPPPPAPKPPTTPATAPARGDLGITAPTDMDYSFTTVVPLNTQS